MDSAPPSDDGSSSSGDDYNSTSHTESFFDERDPKKTDEDEAIAKTESRVVRIVRVLVLLLLLVVTAGVSYGVFYYVSNSETKSFEEDFQDSSTKVLDAVGSFLDHSLGAVDNFMVGIVTNAEETGSEWPFVTIPNFAIRATKLLSLSQASICGFYPKVSEEERSEWEEWALANDEWVDVSLKVQREDPTYAGTNVESWYPSSSISNNDGPLPINASGPHYPAYYTSPIVPVWSAYGWDLYQSFQQEIDEMEQRRSVIVGRTLNIPKSEQHTISWIEGMVGPDLKADEPIVPFYYPIDASASSGVAVANSEQDGRVVGAIAVTMFWRELLRNILSPGSDGIVAVIGSKCQDPFTYQINGPDAVYLGSGDRHDEAYNRLAEFSFLHDLRSSGKSYTGFPLSSTYCPYWIRLYASDTMRDSHETNNPLLFTIVALSIFMFTSAVFVLYDCVSERRQKKVLSVAVKSTAVVSGLFPKVVRDRIFPTEQRDREDNGRATNTKNRLQTFLSAKDDKASPVQSSHDSPIAELFAETTVMFADIAGFTAWCSVREPTAVFSLLEALYGSFDRIAHRRGVFKVETIGDSYVAVAGLPDVRPDHALVMAKFARDCRSEMKLVTSRLGRVLGPDTAELEIRIGLNSGPVTAGVLRGDRSRFQLFGDTVNTAARMESTGIVSKIQVSENTAALLKIAGKEHWLHKREGKVAAKGKGSVQTYFVEPSNHATSEANESTSSEKKTDEKTSKLVEWNVGILTRWIQKIVAHDRARERAPATKTPQDGGGTMETVHFETGATVLEEVADVLELPAFDPNLSHNQEGGGDAQALDKEVQTQLHDFVSIIAKLYKTNSFHNFEHASHCTMSVSKLLSRIDPTYGITSDPLTQLGCIFAALIHDVDHQGVTNAQLLAENSPLVDKYKKSMAEQNSVDISWNLFMEPQFEDLRDAICSTPTDMARFRQVVVNAVMATDVLDQDLKALRNERWNKAFAEGKPLDESATTSANRKATIVIEHLIQASDVSHTMQHWYIFTKWNERLFVELYHAFKNGRSAKNPADFWYEGELSFFDNYVIPLAKKLRDCGVFGVSSDEYLSYAIKNRQEWEQCGRDVVESMIQKLETTVSKEASPKPLVDETRLASSASSSDASEQAVGSD
mmetsp:Transcript_18806/g.40484  ORF Transcript_18806/g.40484 Transcript_18806/m.40484 type:complete len:1140 (+) Transcript_18806:117-3536(+)|eukprot:CAMPEP_0168731820 /NCGR_PEP_ID=MMETSP0724-20121128/7457_1 /TAXON_ID=265536 /ORGANISM="Amphiprora sp., Strain CCMP467" /LENGTH=1139 /DNA_ID=CAMNT_0008778829 /DNA_START=40 /DNA_END=3459 /DNA_ORIENTATION=+